jgi:hypothetical protein
VQNKPNLARALGSGRGLAGPPGPAGGQICKTNPIPGGVRCPEVPRAWGDYAKRTQFGDRIVRNEPNFARPGRLTEENVRNEPKLGGHEVYRQRSSCVAVAGPGGNTQMRKTNPISVTGAERRAGTPNPRSGRGQALRRAEECKTNPTWPARPEMGASWRVAMPGRRAIVQNEAKLGETGKCGQRASSCGAWPGRGSEMCKTKPIWLRRGANLQSTDHRGVAVRRAERSIRGACEGHQTHCRVLGAPLRALRPPAVQRPGRASAAPSLILLLARKARNANLRHLRASNVGWASASAGVTGWRL